MKMYPKKDFIPFDEISIQEKIYDNLSLNYIKSYIPYDRYPYTSSCLNLYKIHILINDLILNERINYVELGSGLSTLALGMCIKQNKLDCKVTSFEHDEYFLKIQNRNIEDLGLGNIIDINLAPLKEQKIAEFDCNWYDSELVKKRICDQVFDLMLVDGPPAYQEKISMNRFPAIPMLFNNLEDNCSIYIDDSNRKGESQSIKHWEKSHRIKFQHLGPTFRHYSRGMLINPFV